MLIIKFYDSIILSSSQIKLYLNMLDNDYSKLFFDICRNRV